MKRLLKPSLAATFLVATSAWITMAQQSRQVNDALLKTGSKTGDEWISHGVNWNEQRYNPLKEIDDSNLSRLGVAWSYEIPLAPGNPQNAPGRNAAGF